MNAIACIWIQIKLMAYCVTTKMNAIAKKKFSNKKLN